MPNKKPSDLQTHLGYWLRSVSNAVSQSFARKVEREGVTVAEWVFMRILFDEDGIAPVQLAERMGMTKGAISKLGDRLVDKALILRQPNADGGRGLLLFLTPAARTLVPRLAELADRNDAEFFSILAPEEREQLRVLLKKIALDCELKAVPVN